MSKILVTGGAGFVGSNLVQELIRLNHEVIILDDLSSGHISLVHKDATFIQGSILDNDALKKCFIFKPDFVMHLAALFANQNSVDHPDTDLAVNGLGTLTLLDWSKKHNVQKFLYVSSSCVYGNREIMNEDDETFYPDTPYAITKLLGERYCKFWAEHHELDVVMLRLFNTYGPGEYPGKYRNVIPNFINLALQKKPLIITGTGNETRDFTYVSDTVDGICKALFNITKTGDIFNLATGKKTRILDIANIINDYLSNDIGIVFEPRRSWDKITNRQAVTNKAETILNFTAKQSLTSGIHKTCDWLRNHHSN